MSDTAPNVSEVRQHWSVARALMKKCPALAIATVSPDGVPHVTPVGSLYFEPDGHGVFIDIFFDQLSQNVAHNPLATILALRMNPALWFRAMLQGRFPEPPAARIVVEIGARRRSTTAEKNRWRRRVRPMRRLKGHDLLWGNLDHARDVRALRIVPVRIGPMSRGLFADLEEIDLSALSS